MKQTLKIGTRSSLLALAQTRIFIAALEAANPAFKQPGMTEIVPITTSGDRSQGTDAPLPEGGGGKALFAKEIEAALLEGTIDCAVHFLKDLPPVLPAGLVVAAVLPREDPRDAFFSFKAATLADLPAGAVIGTVSPRRAALVRALRPDLKIVPLRGNVDTRLKKLEDGVVDATLLAAAGLTRLERGDLLTAIMSPEEMLPAAGQGAIAIETRADDQVVRDALAAVHCPVTDLCVTAERAYLREMDGSCRTPLAACMNPPDPEHRGRLDVFAAVPDTNLSARLSFVMQVQHVGDALRLGEHAGREMKKELEKLQAA